VRLAGGQARPLGLEAVVRSIKEKVEAFEARLIRDALRECEGNVSATARLLDMPNRTLVAKIHKHGLVPDRFRPKKLRTGGYSPNLRSGRGK
jgi:DNA-binding NtrC family response regulator